VEVNARKRKPATLPSIGNVYLLRRFPDDVSHIQSRRG
jgi:hypothetical protein